MREDACIVHKCLNGEPEAFGILVDKYKAGIYAYVYAKLGNFHDAQDVTQEVFLEAYRSLRNLKRWESFSFWIYRIANNICGNTIRSRSRRPDREFAEDQDGKTLDFFSISSYRQSQLNESLHEALASLSRGYREVLMLHYFGGMNSVDIARSLGTSPTAIRKRLSRARAQLREEMLDMMGTAYEGQKLQATFTFRVVEAAKRIKIPPMPRATTLPWELSLAAGIIMAILSFNPHLDLIDPQNFPNPFNPETWLPYELASDAHVMISIYNSSGEIVRKLNPGSQEAGFYTTRDNAAYWDGKNEAGEQVSSGVYFYTIQADEFAATKKMSIAD